MTLPPKSTSYVAFWNEYSPGAICSGAATHFKPSSSSTLAPESIVSTVTSTSLSGIVNVYTDVLPALAASSLTMFTSAAVTNVTIFHAGVTTVTVTFVPTVAWEALVDASTSSGATIVILWAVLPPSPPSPPPGCVPSSPHAARQKDSASTAATATSAVMSFLFIEIPSSRAFSPSPQLYHEICRLSTQRATNFSAHCKIDFKTHTFGDYRKF